MTTYNTGNPVPSADARDRYDNSQTLDEVVNGDSASYETRTGKQVISLGGMNSRFNNAQDEREADFNLSQEEKQESFQKFLDGTGWSSLGAYGAGVVITSHTQTIDYQGQPYQLKPSIPASLDAPYITTGVWATEGVNFKLVGDNSLRQDLADPSQGARMLAYLERSVYDKLSDFVCITDHYRSGDGGQWHQAYARAIAVSPRVRFPFRTDIKYEFGVTQSLPDNAIILADPGAVLHSPEATNAAGTAMLRIFNTTGGRNIGLIGVKFDGGVREVQTAKSYVRPVEFKNCENVVAINCEIVNNPDWSMSFEGCTNVAVRAYKQRSYVYADDATTRARAGGRDGLHFMDCTNVYADDLDIESGDDCVGITSRDTGCANINITRVHGSSVIGSPVIYNEEQVRGSYVAKPMIGLHIKDIRVKDGYTVRNVVRVQKYNPLSVIRDLTVVGVTGQSSNHGARFAGIDEGFVDEINTVSTEQHGVYFSQCSGITGSARGKSLLAKFDGVQLNECKNMNMVLLSTGAANYGMHLLAVVDSVITPLVNDCGGVAFASNTGGNGRMVNCIGVEIPNGVLSGAVGTSYYGLTESGNTDCRVGRGVKARGFINRQGAQNPISVFQEPTVAVRFSESGGVLTVSAALGCSVTLVSLGVYKISFSTPMRSTNFNYQAFASSVGAVRNIKQVSAALVGEVTISTVDAAGAVAASIVSFLAYDS